jgi:hypothetical protein
MDDHIQTGIHVVWTVAAIFPYLCYGKKSHSWSNTECRPDMLLKRLNRCKLEQFEASDTEEGPDGKFSSSGRMMLWTVGRPDSMSHRPNGYKGSDFSDLQNLLEAL